MDKSNSNNPNSIDNSCTGNIAFDSPINAISPAENNENKNVNQEEITVEAPQQEVAGNKAQTQSNPYTNQPTPQIPKFNYNSNAQQPPINSQSDAYRQQVNPAPIPPQRNQPPVYNQPQWNNPPVYSHQVSPAPIPQRNQPPVYNQQANSIPKQHYSNQQATPQPNNTAVNNAYNPNNPYAQSNKRIPNMQEPYQANPDIHSQQYNSNIPHIEYIPYTPGTPLPKGVTPQFINGGWYYAITINPKKTKRKMATSVKVFVGIIIALTISFSGLLVGWTMHLTKENGGDDEGNPFFEFELPFDTNDKTNENKTSSTSLANPDGPEIKLEENNTKDGSTEKAYEVLSESVVSIAVYSDDEKPSTSTPMSEGTGIIISKDGYIVTNSHVVLDDVDSNTWVTTKSGDVYPVGIVGCDVRTDLAVLKCEDVNNWKAASFADSDDLSVGQDVVALGSPGGSSYSHSLTRGIISALDRAISGSAVTYIQTDAAINPGNSGGPLANMNGQVVGINTIKIVDTQFEGMGFAIPSVTIKKVADDIIKNGYVTGRARLGLVVTEFPDTTAKLYDAPAGIKVETIDNDSPFEDTDVKEGDIITEIDGTTVSSFNELYNVLDLYKPGDTVTLTIYRIDEKDTDKNKEFKVYIKLLGDR